MQLRARLQHSLGSRYTLGPELGAGGDAPTFLAEETAVKRKVVVKVLAPDLATGLDAERFRREIEIAALLRHDHIVPVLPAGAATELPHYAMPFVDGESLRARLTRLGMLGVNEVATVLRDVARALAYAHEHGVLHGDLRPETIWIAKARALVTELGVVRAIERSRGERRVNPSALPYLAPELALGDQHPDHEADLYALGCTAYEMLTGAPPFVEESRPRLLAAHMARPPVHVRARRTETPEPLAALVMRCLEKDSEHRPRTAAEVVRALEAMSAETPPVATQPAAEAPPSAEPPPKPLDRLAAIARRIRDLSAGARRRSQP